MSYFKHRCLPLQFVREFAKLGLTRSVGGVLGLALARELTPVITSIILAGKLSRPPPYLPSTQFLPPRQKKLSIIITFFLLIKFISSAAFKTQSYDASLHALGCLPS
jgi:hypothetical protein